MKQIQDVPQHELVYHLRRLQIVASEVAYAKNETDMEYYTIRLLRPELEKLEQLIGSSSEISNSN